MVRSLLARGLMVLVLAAASGARAEPADSVNPETSTAESLTPESLTDADRSTIRSVIEAQIAAFRSDDEATAFSFASPSIQQQFGDPATFLAMVRTAYIAVYRPREVRFGQLVEDRPEPVQTVVLVGPELEVVTAFYAMEKQPDGSWRIDGCVLQESPDRAL